MRAMIAQAGLFSKLALLKAGLGVLILKKYQILLMTIVLTTMVEALSSLTPSRKNHS